MGASRRHGGEPAFGRSSRLPAPINHRDTEQGVDAPLQLRDQFGTIAAKLLPATVLLQASLNSSQAAGAILPGVPRPCSNSRPIAVQSAFEHSPRPLPATANGADGGLQHLGGLFLHQAP